ncbi:MAG: MFS transporter [Desulfobacterales bacterium]
MSKKSAYYAFTLLMLLYVFDYVDRMVIASLFPFLKQDWGLTDTQCGWLASIVTLTMTVFAFPISFTVDRWSRKKAIGLMAMIWSFAAIACAFARNFKQLLIFRSIIGVGEAAYASGGFAMIAAYFPENKRAMMNGIFSASVPLGTSIGIVLGGFIAVKLGWQYAFGLTAIPGLIVALLFFGVKDYKTVDIIKQETAIGRTDNGINLSLRDILKVFMRTPSVIYTYLGYAGNAFVTTALITWLPTYFHRTEGLPMDKAGIKSSLIFLLAIVGAPLGGIIADRIRKKQLNARMTVPAVTSLIGGIVLFIAFMFFEGKMQYSFFLLCGLVLPMYAAAASAVTQDVVHPGLRAMSYSMAIIFMMSLGYSLSPIFVGFISDRYSLLLAFRLLPIFSVFASIAFYLGSFYYVRDFNRVEKIILEMEN